MPERLIISRTDSLGDVVLTLPVAVWLKKEYPGSKIIFLGRDYSRAVIEACSAVDEFISADSQYELNADAILHVFPVRSIAKKAKQAGIKIRVGTSHRIYHWWTCNHLLNFGRKKSTLHEAQLNFKLLEPFAGQVDISLEELKSMTLLNKVRPLAEELQKLLDPGRINVILHPKSKGSAREWGLDNFGSLVRLLPRDKFKIFVTGTEAEGELCKDLVSEFSHLNDLTGELSLDELISFISCADALVAASTGPLHIAAACGIHAIGIYAPMRPIHPGRWAPLGPKAEYLVLEKECSDCRKSGACHCIKEISPSLVAERLNRINK